MKPAEKTWLATLRKFTEFVRVEAPHSVDGFTGFLARLTPLLEDPGTPAKVKYDEARQLQGVYGGMGSVNDYPWSKKAEQSKETLYVAIGEVLRVYWGDMGHPVHDPRSFELYAIGTGVRLVAGRTLIVDRDSKERRVTKADARRKWKVTWLHPPDISGMPMYQVQAGSHIQLARHDAIELEATVSTPVTRGRRQQTR